MSPICTSSDTRRVCTFQLDPDAHAMLLEMTTTKSRGAFIAGLVRAEYARLVSRHERRVQGLSGIEPHLLEH